MSTIGWMSAITVRAAQFGGIGSFWSTISRASRSTSRTTCGPAPGSPMSADSIPSSAIMCSIWSLSSIGGRAHGRRLQAVAQRLVVELHLAARGAEVRTRGAVPVIDEIGLFRLHRKLSCYQRYRIATSRLTARATRSPTCEVVSEPPRSGVVCPSRKARATGVLDRLRGLGVAEVVEHQGRREDGARRIGLAGAGVLGGRAVDRLEHRGLARMEVRRGRYAQAALERGAQVGDDVAEHVVGDDHVEALRVLDHLHGQGVHEQVARLDLRILRGDLGETRCQRSCP